MIQGLSLVSATANNPSLSLHSTLRDTQARKKENRDSDNTHNWFKSQGKSSSENDFKMARLKKFTSFNFNATF